VEQIAAHLGHGKPLPLKILQQVIVKTEEVPLFVEERLKMLLESELVREEQNLYMLAGPLSLLAIPATLQDSLMARLDRLNRARERVSVTTAEAVPFISQGLQMLPHAVLDFPKLSAAIAVVGCQRDVGITPEFGAPVLSVDVHMSRLTAIIRVKVEAIRTRL